VSGPIPGTPPVGRGLSRPRVPGTAVGDRGWSVLAGVDLVARVVATDVRDGDLAIDVDPDGLSHRRQAVVDRPWLWLRQVHGSEVVALGADDDLRATVGTEADAAVTDRLDVVLAAHSADCATIALVGRPSGADREPVVRRGGPPVPWPHGDGSPMRPGDAPTGPSVIGVVHAGWRGLEAGVLDAAVADMRTAGAEDVVALLGPCIGVECYEFGESDLARVVERIGPAAAGRTRDGQPALDLRLGVRSALAALGVEVVAADQRCTACSTTTRAAIEAGAWDDGPFGPVPEWRTMGAGPIRGDRSSVPVLHSHRARGDLGRQALVVWLERPSLGGGSR
jgi:copper oxidase (laccase) domain-containing protein